MSRFAKGKRQPGAEFTWDADPGGEPDTAPTPLYPAYVVPWARKLTPKDQNAVDHYRHLREQYQEGPFYSVLDSSSSSAKKGSAARVNFDSFTGMPTFSGRYQKKRRTIPRIDTNGNQHEFALKFFPRELWQTIQPSYRPDAGIDGWKPGMATSGVKRGFEDEEDEGEDSNKKRATGGGDDDEGDDADDGELLDEEEGQEEWEEDDNYEDDEDELGGDYNAEQYFDGGDDEFGDDGFGDGGGGGEDEL
ncbi:hypothetical protein N7478_002918 [Penicillium angulare]|uniref:uncharacterized protein n=1 Tax=Penicillium angulare TaxID=116970 RepID=UPI0025417BB9|nr:uncharacterized protein N7478_002918 [Penicillium angulare]KAJ5287232.1 hypothetical protein N7478_002918 [Penicillium angulare]